MPSKRLHGKKSKARRLNYSSRSAGLPFTLAKINGGKNHIDKQYTPCSCVGLCGKYFLCIRNNTFKSIVRM